MAVTNITPINASSHMLNGNESVSPAVAMLTEIGNNAQSGKNAQIPIWYISLAPHRSTNAAVHNA